MSSTDGSGPGELPTQLFDWGRIKWRVSLRNRPDSAVSVGDVAVFPGKGHARHLHPGSDEVIYVLSGTGEQTVDDGPAFPIAAGDVVHIPRGTPHSTHNTGWTTLQLVVVYGPAGAEEELRGAPDFREVPAGTGHPVENG
ncbi:cupin domain-containing protein [Nocardiopsis potens]|uniref:cupin domain-containing protein n=1 Tax=Nocardiopsis potens TaxID=1246458 RepID=UPI00034C0D68|nr:cupin domain-containing protein [Nocardiopsis potens]